MNIKYKKNNKKKRKFQIPNSKELSLKYEWNL